MNPVNHESAKEIAVPAKTGSKPSFYRWVIIALAFLITLVNYMDRSAIAYAIKPIKAEFGFDDASMGLILGGLRLRLYGHDPGRGHFS